VHSEIAWVSSRCIPRNTLGSWPETYLKEINGDLLGADLLPTSLRFYSVKYLRLARDPRNNWQADPVSISASAAVANSWFQKFAHRPLQRS
jgi:hypothetical protein